MLYNFMVNGGIRCIQFRCLTKNCTAVIQIRLSRPMCLELYQESKDLGRFMLRSGGNTIAAGIVTNIF